LIRGTPNSASPTHQKESSSPLRNKLYPAGGAGEHEVVGLVAADGTHIPDFPRRNLLCNKRVAAVRALFRAHGVAFLALGAFYPEHRLHVRAARRAALHAELELSLAFRAFCLALGVGLGLYRVFEKVKEPHETDLGLAYKKAFHNNDGTANKNGLVAQW